MKVQLWFLLLVFWLPGMMGMANAQESWSTDYAYYGVGGVLTYTPDDEGNVIPDFSNVGYAFGDVEIPVVNNVVEVVPVEGDDAANIQLAINSLYEVTPDENGIRGAVLLKAGTYQVETQLKIEAGGIVLRGEGQDDNGTIIIATGKSDRSLIEVGGSASLKVENTSKVNVAEDFVPMGRKYIKVSSTASYTEGDQIAIYRPGTANWISDIKMDQISGSESTQWTASSYNFYFERTVSKVSGDTLFFRNPIVMALDKKYGGGFVYKCSFDRIENVGIENLCLKSEYASETDEEHSWKAIQINSAENSWVKDVTSYYFAYACVSLEREARMVSVLNCSCYEPKSIITGSRRYSFYCEGQLNLFKGCQTTEGRHDYVTGSRVCGPNVFTQCTARSAYNDAGPHHRWAMGTLYDVIDTDGELNVQDRDDMGSGHGWAGANQVFWNCKAASSVCQSPWVSAKNYNIGFQGEKSNGARAGRPDGVWVGHNQPGLFPSSLYEAQLNERLSQTKRFSALPQLEQIDNSSYKMSFNMPVNIADVVVENFSVGGTAGIEMVTFSVSLIDAYSIKIAFAELGILPSLSTIVIDVRNIHSAGGLELTGLTTSSYTEPDKRPVVSGPGLTTSNDAGSFVVAQSTKTGFVYLNRMGEPHNTIDDLEQAIVLHKGAKAEVNKPNVSVPIYTFGLYGGFYYLYAIDEEGRISEAGAELIQIQETSTVGVDDFSADAIFKVGLFNRQLIINPPQSDLYYQIAIFNLTGKMVLKSNEMLGLANLQLPATIDNMLIVRITSACKTQISKITVMPN